MFTEALSQDLKLLYGKTVWLMNNHGEESVSGDDGRRVCCMYRVYICIEIFLNQISLSLSLSGHTTGMMKKGRRRNAQRRSMWTSS